MGNETELEMRTFEVKACWSSVYEGVPCLESDDSFGFFKSENDKRPSSCVWVKKNDAKILTQLSLDKFTGDDL